MLKTHGVIENHHSFKYKPKPYSDSIEIRWPVEARVIALQPDVAGFLLKMSWARPPSDEEIAWWNDLIDKTEAAIKAAEPEPEEPVEPTGAQALLAATQAPAAVETAQEAVDNGANGTASGQGGAAGEGGTSEGEEKPDEGEKPNEESKEEEKPSEEEGSKEGEEKPAEEQKETESTSTKKKASEKKGLL